MANRRTRSPRPRGDDLRRAPKARSELRVIYVVAEGEGTEYDYLAHLNRRFGSDRRFLLRNPNLARQRNGLSPRKVVEEASRIVDEDGVDEVWALFDHDRRSDIAQVYSKALSCGVKPALSHPAFELWLLLHFQHRTPSAQGGHNKSIIESLRKADSTFADYGRDDKRIDDQRFQRLCEDGGIREAVRQSRALVDACPSGCGCSSRDGHATPCSPDMRDPSTDVYLLIQSLGIM